MNRVVIILRSKTFWGAVLAAAGWLLGQQHVGVPEAMQAIGGVITATGLRDALTVAVVELLSRLAQRHHLTSPLPPEP